MFLYIYRGKHSERARLYFEILMFIINRGWIFSCGDVSRARARPGLIKTNQRSPAQHCTKWHAIENVLCCADQAVRARRACILLLIESGEKFCADFKIYVVNCKVYSAIGMLHKSK